MKNRMKKMISLTMVLALLLIAFAGCGDAMYGDKETTPPVNAGANPDNLGNDNNSGDETSMEENEAKWQEAEIAIKSEYVSLGFKEENLSVVRMADFGDVYVGMVRTGEWYIQTYETIGGLDFVYNYSSLCKDSKTMDVYYNGECYKLSDAYENGIIKYEELWSLFDLSRGIIEISPSINKNYEEDWCIVLIVTPSNNYKNYTMDDFAELGCVSVENWGPKVKDGRVSRWLKITFNSTSAHYVNTIVKRLLERTDVYSLSAGGLDVIYLDVEYDETLVIRPTN